MQIKSKGVFFLLSAILLQTLLCTPFLSADSSGAPGSDLQQCINRASYLPNPADRTAVCECIHGQRPAQQCEQWKNEMERLLTGNYPAAPPPSPPDRTPSIAVCLTRASYLSNPADRTAVCECLAGIRSEPQCGQWKNDMQRILIGDYPAMPPPAVDRTPSIAECLPKAALLPDLINPADRTAVCECLAGIRSEAQCSRWKDAMRHLLIADYSAPAASEKTPFPQAEDIKRAASFKDSEKEK